MLTACAILLCCAPLFAETSWPLVLLTEGYRITIYPPQSEPLTDGVLVAHATVAVLAPGGTQPAMGLLKLEAQAGTSPESQRVMLKNLHIPSAQFPELDRAQELYYTTLIAHGLADQPLDLPKEALALPTESNPRPAADDLQHLRTASVRRGTQLTVTYAGPPHFVPIEQTRLHYADNTDFQVLREGADYFCADRGIWYTARAPQGPWEITDHIPADIQHIPASNPMYNTRFLYINRRTDREIHYGFNPGYLQGRQRWGRFGGWGINYESPDYSIQVDPVGGALYFRESSTQNPHSKPKNWGRDTSKFPEFSK